MNGSAQRFESWADFRGATRNARCRLMTRLASFPDAILIAGCQRSGTTALAELVIGSAGMTDYRSGGDSELEGALLLSGIIPVKAEGRYCFQTTYLDQRFGEYFSPGADFRLIWLVRNPYSTVYSLLYNWVPRALDRTFAHGAYSLLTPLRRWQFRLRGPAVIDRLRRACLVYNWKSAQICTILPRLGADRVMVIEYDTLVADAGRQLQRLYTFLELDYRPSYARHLRHDSTTKHQKLSDAERSVIRAICLPLYADILRRCHLEPPAWLHGGVT